MSKKALVVLSGGQDSTTCLFWALQFYSKVIAITFDYGQAHRIEIEAAAKIAEMAGVDHEVIDVPGCLISSSPLTNNGLGLERYEDAEQMDKIIGDRREATFVPMRNALFLTIAANRAEAWGGADIITGVCQMDNANYDDCRQVFIDAATEFINTALGHDHRGTPPIKIVTPLMNATKEQTVHIAYANPACWEALAYSHTSYDGKYPPTDMNHANVLRADGFEKAGRPDPLVLRAHAEGLMELPETANYDGHR
jgi:7-cyano-7-deazaguanine synthase